MPAPRYYLPVIVFAQFAGTSLVQLGFIAGTLVFALLTIALCYKFYLKPEEARSTAI